MATQNKELSLSDEEIYKEYVNLKNKIELDIDNNNNNNNNNIKEMKNLLLKVLIKYKAIKIGNFILKSKRTSSYFFSSGMLNNVLSSNIVASLITNLIITKKIKFDYLLGASYKGIPIVTLTSHFLFNLNKFSNVFFLYDRKEQKGYGDKNMIIGNIEEITNNEQNNQDKKKVIIIDDVFTCGTALTEIMNKLKCYNFLQIVAFVVLLNRNEYELNEKNEKIFFKDTFEQKYNIPLYSIINYEEDLRSFVIV
ncbi:orotate phosphoribosyltransferase [Hepatocystis sp. ex Piliocolobus tephrosceles]|nr:orotate phosphoribosyltransferase [Hepatocystis sp. ex Piliocolobus tephrosceles]